MSGGTAFSASQLAEVNAAVSVGVATALPRIAARFKEPKAVLKALKDKGEILTGHLELALALAIGRMMTLVPRERVDVTLAERHDPAVFFYEEKTPFGTHPLSPGLGLIDGHFGGFSQTVLPKANPVEVGTRLIFDAFEIGDPTGASEDEIESALPQHHLFGESVLCAIIAHLISRQPRGEPGTLEHTGKSNLFFHESLVVQLQLSAGNGLSRLTRGWQIHGWERTYRSRWASGSRVFSPI